ncbi:hypothetical protein STSP2_02677 [Anaerohalosphaera lusitana]|uniref:Uncharacterized protein n=1 Tax=Anaerohalosphaera lusitana TaxID=1936003 RepID=A0A1U9NPP8_9BACT|nr:hypothetical protein [Anaerohalosphaera lusitana]AQT69486.1 hypothetical protein STSP2_02677 [Anaerohalosphaera lusitana]
MKKSPDMEKLESVLRSSKLVAGGFLGDDPRDLTEILDTDAAAVEHHNKTHKQIAKRMRELTEAGIARLGMLAEVEGELEVMVDEAKGILVCPWPHSGRFAKRITAVRNKRTGQTIQWSDLNIHLIEEHGFYEGKGSAWRLEPDELIRVVFPNSA